MKFLTICILLLNLSLLFAASALADTPNILYYKGSLLSVEDNSPVSAEIPMIFSFYSYEDSEEPIWEEAHEEDFAVVVDQGNFIVGLGSITPIPPDIFDGPTLYLGITVGDEQEELLPRQPIGGSPYALLSARSLIASRSLLADDAETLSGMEASEFVTEEELDENAFLTETDLAPVALSNDYNDLDNKPDFSGLEDLNTSLLSSVITRYYNSEDTPITDPQDGESVISTIEFPDSGTIRSVKVTLNIAHEDVSELTVTLTSPTGITVTLHQGEEEDLSVTFPGDRNPSEGSFEDFYGEEVLGTWALTLSDETIGNVGTLEGWRLEITLLSSDQINFRADIDLENHVIGGAGEPVEDSDLANKNYVDTMRFPSELISRTHLTLQNAPEYQVPEGATYGIISGYAYDRNHYRCSLNGIVINNQYSLVSCYVTYENEVSISWGRYSASSGLYFNASILWFR